MTDGALRRVLQSLLAATRRLQMPGVTVPAGPWSDDFQLGERAGEGPGGGSAASLGCDSLDLLQMATAVNEMFHLHEVHLETALLQARSFGAWAALVQEAWRRGVERITVTTSGSSGRPTFCVHPMQTLHTEIDTLAALFGDTRRVVAFTPAHHVYGLLFTAMLPDRLGIPVMDLQNPGPDGAAEQMDDTRLRTGDLVVSFPEGWRWIQQNVRTVPAGVEGVVSTAPCPRELIASLLQGTLQGFTEVYGASETGGIGTRRWPEEAYTLMPHWRVADEPGPDRGPRLLHRAGGMVEPMDHLQFTGRRTFVVSGRKDQGVQVGGMNVFPSGIAARLKGFPGVADAAVRLMRPDEGERLKCFVVPDVAVSEDFESRLRAWVATWPAAAERPKAFSFGAALPRNAVGKMCDW